MWILLYYSYFSPSISAACFKISTSIFSYLFSLRNNRSSFSLSDKLSLTVNFPLLSYCFSHVCMDVLDTPCSFIMFAELLPALRSSTFFAWIHLYNILTSSLPPLSFYLLYHEKLKFVQFIITYLSKLFQLLAFSVFFILL
mgnify:FL=1